MASDKRRYRLINLTRGGEVAASVRRADRLLSQTVGLMFRRSLPPGEGLWLTPCNGLHTFGMRFPIDVIVLDSDMSVLNIIHAMEPFRVVRPMRRGHSIVELSAGAAAEVCIGDQLETVEI